MPANDCGGNEVPVLYRGHRSNLHHLWDTELVQQAGGTDAAALAQRLEQAVTPANIAALAAGSPVDWANETHAAAVSVAYGALPENADADLAGAYADTARSVVDSQLLKAGLRLAALLNAALK